MATNQAAVRVTDFLIGESAHTNMMLQFFDPNDMRAAVVNWGEVAGDLIQHLHDGVAASPTDSTASRLLDRMLEFPDVPPRWRTRELSSGPSPLPNVKYYKDDQHLRFFSTITSFGTAKDVTVDELRIECTFPADEATATHCRALAGG